MFKVKNGSKVSLNATKKYNLQYSGSFWLHLSAGTTGLIVDHEVEYDPPLIYYIKLSSDQVIEATRSDFSVIKESIFSYYLGI